APDRAASEDLGKLGEVVASHLKTAGLGGEVVPDELQRLVIRQIPEMRDVVPDERSQVVIDDRDLLLISLVERPELAGFFLAQPEVHGDQSLAIGANCVAQELEADLRR